MSMLTVEECELLGDSKYRSYISQVEKALKYFETTSEWADLISALGKLNKVLLSHMKYPVIPKRVIIGKRLAQCLHPALPSGVHLKALETYDIIFKSIGLERLSQDLFIYTAGLFPLMSHAAMNVKPVLLDLYECHFVPLRKHIKPGLNGLLLGLLPGMEEGSELSYRCDKLLVDFSQVTDESYFYSCMWQCIYTFPAARLQAITFLLAHYNKKQSMEDQLYMMGLNIDLMVQAACTAVQDSIVLVQRSLLDFLLIAFPMHNAQLTKSDMLKILKAAVTVILRRDMSLNRRLYAWLLGTDCNGVPLAGAIDARQRHSTVSNDSNENPTASNKGENDQSYFHTFSKDLLVLSLKARLYESSCSQEYLSDESSTKASLLQPFRILISLLDKPEIGAVILENVLWAIFRSLYKECKSPSNTKMTSSQQPDEKVVTELLKTANLLFNSFEPFYIWDFIGRMFESACQKSSMQTQTAKINLSELESSSDMPDFIELCELCNFLLDVISLETYLETQTEFLPNLLRRMITSLINYSDKLHNNQIMYSLKLCDKILTRAQPSMTVIETGDKQEVVNNVFSVEKYSNERQKSESSASSTSEDLTIESTDSGALNDFETLSSPQILKCESESVSQNSQIEMTECTPVSHVANLRATFYRMTNSPIKSADKIVSVPLTLMQACVQCFQDFFHTFVSRRIFNEDTSVNNLLDSITLPVDSARCSDKDSVIGSSSSIYSQDETLRKQSMENRVPQKISVKSDSDFCEAFTWACRLLVEFASFPIYCTDYHKILEQSFQQEEDSALPPWLQDLILCSCFVDNFHIQVAAISTMLDLVSLTQSVECESRSKDDGSNERKSTSGNDGGTISVVILPALLPRHLKYLNNNTLFYQMVAQNLWNHLDASTCNNHQRSVELFQQLHQVTPNSWVCEDVIGSALVGDEPNTRIEAFRKFTVLWHLIRDKKTSRAPGMPLRTFDRSMFAVLDSLREDTSSAKTLASTWLMHTIQRGGIYRILEPTLLILLHPDTARISIQHVSIHQPQKVKLSDVDEDKSDAKIFAISSEGGNVIYHVSSKTRNISKKNVEELKSFALTVMNEKGSGVLTASTKAQIDMPFERVNPENLKLRINPFGGSENSLDRLIFDGFELPPPAQNFDLRSIRRLTKETCLKEGIYFDEKDQLDNSEPVEEQPSGTKADVACTVTDDPTNNNNMVTVDESTSETSENIVSGILDDLVNKVTREPLLLSKQVDIPDDFSIPDGKSGSMSKDSSVLDDEDLLNAIDKRGLEIDSPTGSESDLSRPFGRSSNNVSNNMEDNEEEATGIHTLHMHILLYVQKYDCQQTLYALSTLKSMLVTCPRLMVTAMATTSINNNRLQQLPKLQMLLARHRKSVFGNNFFGELPSDVISNYRTNMYLEIVISLCLYFIRSYYPNLMMSKLSLEELHGNKEVHILSAEILTHLVSELIHIMKESGKSFVSYISDLLTKCKLQKAILHSVLASVYNSRQISDNVMHRVSFTETIISFNEDSLEQSANETFQIKLLNLLLVMIMLEGHIHLIKGSPNSAGGDSTNADNTSSSVDWDRTKVNFNPSLSRVRYNSGRPIVQQGMFLSAVLSALKQSHRAHMHRHWISMVTAALPHMGKAMAMVVMNVVSQLCRNLESISSLYTTPKEERKQQMKSLPPDHVLTMLEGLTRICHYCLLDNSSPVLINQHSLPNLGIQSAVDSYTAGQILTNLIHVFNPVSGSREANSQNDAALLVPLLEARTHLLSILPRIIGCMATLWKAINESERNVGIQHNWIIGTPKIVRSYILEFLSPVAVPHGCNLLGSVAVAWNDRRRKVPGYNKKVIPVPCDDQLLLVDLVDAIKVLPTDTLVQTVKQVLKQPPPCDLGQMKKSVSLEINMLQFFYAYIQKASVQQLLDSKQSLLSLLKEGQALNLSPPGLFLLLEILNEFVQRTPTMEDRKSQKDIQDIAQKLVEAVSTVAGLCLEQTTWLRRNLAVKPGPQTDILETEEGEATEESDVELTNMAERKVIEPQLYSNTDVKYCVQALTILAELTAPLLDVVYGSDEKERIASFLTSIMYNVFPYLRNHSGHNIPSFRAASQLLSSISGYQYTRKAWRKEAFDLLMDPSFFQMDLKCLCHWGIVIDNLMTHDKTTFKDLMSRVAITQSGSLNLFSSKEQEFELRAQMLKRLSFTILSSESDQYQRNMPDIQERLAECLRTPQVPSVMSQVFLCFRVLILRMSPLQLTSLWPIIITEMVNVFLQIEQELSTDTDEFRAQLQRIAALESSWAHLGNGLNAHNNPIWLQLYLSVCKLLDMALILPADVIPQFQLYKWAFTGGPSVEEEHQDVKQNPKIKSFVCHVTRISKLLNSRIPTLDILKPSDSKDIEQRKKRNAVRNKKRKLSRKRKRHKPKQVESNVVESDEDSESEEEEDIDEEKNKEENRKALKSEEKTIKQLEKKLGLKKRKTLPQSFIDDGLGYILDVTGDFKNCVFPLQKDNGSDSDSAGDKSDDDDSKDSDSGMIDENCDDDDDDEDGDDDESIPELVEVTETKQASILKMATTEDSSEKSVKKKVKFDESVEVSKAKQVKLSDQNKDTLKEDIYGRLRDVDGKVVPSKPTGYIPPALRQNISRVNVIDTKVNKQMKGLVNRVNEANMSIMSQQLEEMYSCHSRALLNKCFFENISSTAIRPESSLDRLLLELALLIAIIHSNVGEEISAYIIQHLIEKMYVYRKKKGGKELNNIITLLCCMYNLKIFHSTLLFDLTRLFMDSFQEKDVEILSIIFKNCGFGLRKDDPTQLRDVISNIQQKSSTVNTEEFEEPGRMRFILDTLLAVKNNNVCKGDHQERLELLQRFIKLAKHLTRNKSIGDNQLRVSLSDLQNADTKGRWWIVGSAWSGEKETSQNDKELIPSVNEDVKNFLELSRKQRMNTDIRRNIFCTLMASEDFVDAFQRLLQLKLKSVQERDIVHVIVDCCIQEKEYNPYYAHLLQKFCEFHRRFQMTFQFNLWDKLKDMSSLKEAMMSNLAKLVSHLIVSKAQSLALFKVLEFGTLDKQTVFFLKAVLLDLFENNQSHVVKMVFERVSIQTNLYKFREGLRLFIMHFLIGRKKKVKSISVIKQLEEAVQILSVSHSSTLL